MTRGTVPLRVDIDPVLSGILMFEYQQQGQSRCVRHYQYTSWPENAPPESAFGVIDLIGQVSKWNTTVGNRPVTVHCRFVHNDCLYQSIVK